VASGEKYSRVSDAGRTRGWERRRERPEVLIATRLSRNLPDTRPPALPTYCLHPPRPSERASDYASYIPRCRRAFVRERNVTCPRTRTRRRTVSLGPPTCGRFRVHHLLFRQLHPVSSRLFLHCKKLTDFVDDVIKLYLLYILQFSQSNRFMQRE